MNNYDIKTPHKYFAAANGYHGFRSYFDSIFASENFLKIYVLKGGPGTGKSSLLKRLSQHFSGMRVYNEAIYCSSDPSSLDGVIIERNARRIAVIDGTAPHERDAVIAGAIDEIINLGENWDSDMLEKKRDEILELNKKKKLAYQNAYQNLRLAGEIDSKIEAEYFNILNSSGIQESANDFANKNTSNWTTEDLLTHIKNDISSYSAGQVDIFHGESSLNSLAKEDDITTIVAKWI